MMRPLMRICEVLAVAFVFGGVVGLAAQRGNVVLDAGLIVTGVLLYLAFLRLKLAQKRIEKRSSSEKVSTGEMTE